MASSKKKSEFWSQEFDQASSEELYSYAYQLYQSGKFDQAGLIFRVLIGRDGANSAYLLGCAASYHKMKHYEAAADLYQLTAVCSPHDPTPLLHAADCMVRNEDPISAIAACESAISRCGSLEKYASLKKQAQLIIEKNKKELLEALK